MKKINKYSALLVLLLANLSCATAALHYSSSYVLVNQVITPKKKTEKKKTWKERLSMALLKKKLKKIEKRQKAPSGKTAEPQKHRLAEIALTTSLIGLMLLFMAMIINGAVLALIGLIASTAGLIMGIISRPKIKYKPEKYTGLQQANWSIILGLIPTALWVGIVIFLFFFY